MTKRKIENSINAPILNKVGHCRFEKKINRVLRHAHSLHVSEAEDAAHRQRLSAIQKQKFRILSFLHRHGGSEPSSDDHVFLHL